ncbi:MAG: XRE family transcriptional regulator [Nevskiaceae bacterium]|nr:MAG: XRE family transcriptional regulator [Nevskiaceae bacterium]
MTAPAPTTLRQLLAKNVRTIREKRGLSQTTLAELSGLNQKTIHHIENAIDATTVDSMEQIAKALGIKPKALFEED